MAADTLVPEGAIHERLGIRKLAPAGILAAGSLRARLDRFRMGSTVFFKGFQVVALMRAESEAWGGVPALDKLADYLAEHAR